MKTILVYGDSENEILDETTVERVPNIIKWRCHSYYVWNSELGHLVRPPEGKDIDEYNGKFFFYYDD